MAASALSAIPDLVELDRELCGRPSGGLYQFIQRGWVDANVQPVDFIGGLHLEIQCEYLEAFVHGEIPRLLINVPPGHMKSLSCSVFLHPWVWGPLRLGGKRFVNTSFRENLALRDAVASRDLILSPWFQRRWGSISPQFADGRDTRISIRPDQNSKERYVNTMGGYRFSCPVSGIMGEGGDYVTFDDPHNVEQAESDGVRDETVRKIKLAIPTRVRSKNGGYLVIMQRLHSKDYAGHMIAEEHDMVHLCLPARFEYDHPHVTTGYTLDSGRELPADPRLDWGIYEQYVELAEAGKTDKAKRLEAETFASKHNGALLWPQFYGDKRVAALENTLSDYGVAGQLQQRPVPRDGGLLLRTWFDDNMIDERELPPGRVPVRGWDPAGSTRKKSPYTAGVKMSRLDDTYYVEHVVRERWESGDMEMQVKSVAITDGYNVQVDFPQDPGQAGKSQVKSVAQILVGFVLKTSTETGSKVQRLETFGTQLKHGNVKIVRGGWNDAYIDELCAVTPTGGDYMDQADATSRAFAHLLSSGRRASSGASSGSY